MTRSVSLALLASLTLLGASTAGAQDDGRYMVKFKEFRGAAQAVAAAGGRVALELEPQGVVAAYLPAPAADALRRNPNVEYVEVDPRRYLMGETIPYGIGMVQADDTAFPGTGQSGVTVCIIDSGYYEAHEDLPKEASGGVTGTDGGVTGTDVSGTGSWKQDSCGHGTHVAGTIAALIGNEKGVAGVSSNGTLRLHIVKVFDGADCAWTYSSSLVSALNVCLTNVPASKKRIVSMSLGGSLSSRTEDSAFQNAYNNGVLSIAAAGNDGNTRKSYPASYASVVSVAAVDSSKALASFSQRNDAVELAAPGVGVLSTTPFKPSTLTVGSGAKTYIGANIDGSARIDVSGKTLVGGGLCDVTNTAAWTGKIVLCERGTNSFAQKVANVQNSGGLGTAIYNNVAGGFAGTLNGSSTIPAISLSREDGLNAAANYLNQSSDITNQGGTGSGYEAWDGTSMATPHVSGVAALVWSQAPTKTNAEVRAALQATAEDLGAIGKDTSYGYGLVRAKAALDYLNGTGGPPPANPVLSAAKVKLSGQNYVDLAWTGITGTTVKLYQNGATSDTANDGAERRGPLARGTYTFKVCTSDGSSCTNEVTVRI